MMRHNFSYGNVSIRKNSCGYILLASRDRLPLLSFAK